MRNFIDIVLLESMSHAEANLVFRRFGVNEPQNLGLDELKSTYKKLAMANHPDRGGDEMSMSLINRAYAVLKTPAPATKPRIKVTPSSDQPQQRSYYDSHPAEQARRAKDAEREAARARWNIKRA